MNGLMVDSARAKVFAYLEKYKYNENEMYADPATTAHAIAANLDMRANTVKGTLNGLARVGLVSWRYARIPGAPRRVVVYGVTGRTSPMALSQDEMARIRQHLKAIDAILGTSALRR